MSLIELKKTQDKIWTIEENAIAEQPLSKYLLYSSIDKNTEIDNAISRIDFKYHTNFIIFGLKNFDFIWEIYKRKTPFSNMIIIEITDGDCIQFECDPQKINILTDSSVTLAVGNDSYLISQLKSILTNPQIMLNLKNSQIITLPYVKSLYPDKTQEIIKIILESLSAGASAFGNDVQDILIGMDNYISNWKHTFRGIEHIYFENAYKGKPAVIVGAGPSLDKSIEHLKALKGKALILCVDAAMDVLLDEGIVPDIIASIERTECTTTLYQRDYIPPEIVYIGANQVPGQILERMDRIVFTGRKREAFIRSFNESLGLSNLDIGNNVSHILVSFAEFLGCSTVIFTGLDLAYPQGVTHAKRTLDNFTESMKSGYKIETAYAKGQNGEVLETQEYFIHTRVWIEDFILGNNSCVYINSSEGGADIVGARNLNIADAISQYCSDTEISPIANLYDTFRSKYKIDKRTTTEKAIDYFNDLIEYYNEIYNISQENYNLLASKKDTGILKLMEEQRYSLDEELNKSDPGYFIIQSILIKYNRDIRSFPMYLEKEDEIRMKQVNMDFYDTLQKVAQRINKDLNLYLNVLKSHLEAYNEEGDC